jgi:hypothetical protein
MIVHCAVFILKPNQNTLLINALLLDKKYFNNSTNFIELIIYLLPKIISIQNKTTMKTNQKNAYSKEKLKKKRVSSIKISDCMMCMCLAK